MRFLFGFVALVVSTIAAPIEPPSVHYDVKYGHGKTAHHHDTVVDLLQGSYRGTLNLDGVATFLGIPFAAPPVGELRFKAPVPPVPTPRGAVLNTTTYGNACIQDTFMGFDGKNSSQSEDCLNLNIFAPKSSKKLPVLVFVYGGSFTSGSNSIPLYNGSQFLALAQERKAVVVVPNYRVGAFGFLASTELDAEGSLNAGLLDQKAAFEWVRKHIASFGGDPKRIVAWGESAGAISIATHLAANGSCESKLFDAAILNSGGLLPGYGSPKAFQASFDAIAGAAGCRAGASDVVACLRSVRADVLLAASRTPLFLASPAVGGSYLTKQPQVVQAQGGLRKIPMIVMTVTDEGTLFAALAQATTKVAALEFERMVLQLFDDSQFKEIISLYDFNNYERVPDQVADVYGDAFFNCPSLNLADVVSQAGVDVYKARFDVAQSGSEFTKFSQLGVYHGSELPFLWGAQGQLNQTNGEKDVSRMLVLAILDFAWGKAPGSMLKEKWPRYEEVNGKRAKKAQQLVIRNAPEQVQEVPGVAFKQRCGVWNRVALSASERLD